MDKAPSVIGLTLCKRITVDPTAGEMSLVGVFHAMTFKRFPTPAQHFLVYVVLYDGIGEGILELRIMEMATERDVHVYTRWTTLPGRGLLAHLDLRMTRCVFPRPGRYRLHLTFDGTLLSERFLDVLAKG